MKTNSLIILSLLLFIAHFANAQKNTRNQQIGISFSSLGENEPVRFDDVDGAASYDSKSFYIIGINYIHPINNWLDIETGIEYAKHTVTLNPNLPPDMDIPPYDKDFSLINIPLTVRANFLNYFFANGGLLLGFDADTSSPIASGLGAIIGIGAQYQFNNGLGLFVNPYAKTHALLTFSSEKYPLRMIEAGVRVGVTYSFRAK